MKKSRLGERCVFALTDSCLGYIDCLFRIANTEVILESKEMGAIFQKKGNKMLKKGKIFENLGKNVQNLKIF